MERSVKLALCMAWEHCQQTLKDDSTMNWQPPQGICFDVLDDQGVLFSEPDQRMFLLDKLTKDVWRQLFVKRETYQRTAWYLSKHMGCSKEEAEAYVQACILEWQSAGLLGADKPTKQSSSLPILPAVNQMPSPGMDVFCLVGIRFAVSCPDAAVSNALSDAFGHLRDRAVGFPDFTLTIQRSPTGYRLVGPHPTECVLPDAAAVAVHLKIELLEIALRMQPGTVALHAAALYGPTGAILLAGASGSGKTTLAAVLNALGWASIADDIVLLRNGVPLIRGLPLAYATKPGSWSVLGHYFPSLQELRVHKRPDGRLVRYIAPLSISQSTDMPAAVVVFPRYNPASQVEVRPLDRVAALVRILAEARNATHYLSCVEFMTVSAMIRTSTILELEYGDVAAAAATLMHSVSGQQASVGERA